MVHHCLIGILSILSNVFCSLASGKLQTEFNSARTGSSEELLFDGIFIPIIIGGISPNWKFQRSFDSSVAYAEVNIKDWT